MKVLIVDDYVDRAEPVRDNFRFFGHEAHYVLRSEQAVELAMRMKPDWVVIDARMPQMSGTEFFGRLNREADFEFSAVFYSHYIDEAAIQADFERLHIPEAAKISKTDNLPEDVGDRIIPALKSGVFKGGKRRP